MTVDDLANLTKIPRRSLERLEGGAFDRTSDGFVRGFVRTVAEALGLDPDDAVNRLLREPREDEALVRARVRLERRRLLLRASLVAAALAVALLLWRLFVFALGDESASGPPVVYRHDAVRALAAEPAAETPDAEASGSEPPP